MKSCTVSGTDVQKGIIVSSDPYPHITLGSGGHKRATWVALGKRDAETIVRPSHLPCPNRRYSRYFDNEYLNPICKECGAEYSPQDYPAGERGRYEMHPDSGEVLGPLSIGDIGIVLLKDDQGKPNGKYLVVAPRGNDDNRVLVLWKVASGYRGSAQIGIKKPTFADAMDAYDKTGDPIPDMPVIIASDLSWHLGRGSLGETAEFLAVLKPGQEIYAVRSGRRMQDTHGRLTYDGENINVTFGGEEMEAATSDEVEGDYI